jgi:hypothetical protein
MFVGPGDYVCEPLHILMSDVVMLEKKQHKWAAGGVSSYPLTHPIVGQTKFFNQFKHFIHLVDDEAEKFAHVFAVIAQWGIGKSRLGYELVNILPGMNAGASTYTVPSPIEGSGTAWVLLGSWALSPARPTPIHPRHECRGFSAFFGDGSDRWGARV